MCCVLLIQRKNKHLNEMRVLFRCDLKWQTLQPPTLQKYHQFTVFRHRKKSNRVCVTQVCVNTQHPTHAIGVKNNFPFAAGSLQFPPFHANHWERTPTKMSEIRKFTFAISRLAISAAFGIFENCFWISYVPFPVSAMLSHSVRWHCSSCSKSK